MPPLALQKKPEEINRRSADMWSFAVLLWELVTREVPFADLSNMEIGMKVRQYHHHFINDYCFFFLLNKTETVFSITTKRLLTVNQKKHVLKSV